jgi:hypothetical protein
MESSILCVCGAVLVEDVTEEGIRPVGGASIIRFRRTTDYVMCAECLRSYDVRSLIAQAIGRELIENLERLADRQSGAEPEY